MNKILYCPELDSIFIETNDPRFILTADKDDPRNMIFKSAKILSEYTIIVGMLED